MMPHAVHQTATWNITVAIATEKNAAQHIILRSELVRTGAIFRSELILTGGLIFRNELILMGRLTGSSRLLFSFKGMHPDAS